LEKEYRMISEYLINSPGRLNPETRAKIKKIFGVQAIVVPGPKHTLHPTHRPDWCLLLLAVKMIDAETGVIVGQVSVTSKRGASVASVCDLAAQGLIGKR
jgi:hypothetical protein